MNPLTVSIVTINRNNSAGLEKTASSVASQTVHCEWIVIDGASTDESMSVIKKYESYISFWVSEPDAGIYNATNKGALKVKTDYVIFIDSGDALASPDVVERFLARVDGKHDFYIGDAKLVGKGKPRIVKAAGEYSALSLFSMDICHAATFIKMQIFDQLGGYREDFKMISDYALVVEAYMKHSAQIASLDFNVCEYDITGVSATHWWETAQERERLWTELLGPVVYRDYVTIRYGRTRLDKMARRMEMAPFFHRLLTLVSMPVYGLYKIVARLK